MKTVVKMFKPRFAPLVESGAKRQTVRPIAKRARDLPAIGDEFSGREWVGAPYRSKQRVLAIGTIEDIQWISITASGIALDGEPLQGDALDAFAVADGFASFAEMVAWFEANHGRLPFSGIAIFWTLQPQHTNG